MHKVPKSIIKMDNNNNNNSNSNNTTTTANPFKPRNTTVAPSATMASSNMSSLVGASAGPSMLASRLKSILVS